MTLRAPDAGSDAKGRVRYVSVEPGKTVRLEFRGGGTLTGTLLDEKGEPIVGAIVRIAPLEEDGHMRDGAYQPAEAMTDGDGRFSIADSGDDLHMVQVQSTAKGDSFVTRLEDVRLTGDDQELPLRLPASLIAGRITIAPDGDIWIGTRGGVTRLGLKKS